jgi:hypothetical protein
MPPDAKIHDRIDVTDELKSQIRLEKMKYDQSQVEKLEKKVKKTRKKKEIKPEEKIEDGQEI